MPNITPTTTANKYTHLLIAAGLDDGCLAVQAAHQVGVNQVRFNHLLLMHARGNRRGQRGTGLKPLHLWAGKRGGRGAEISVVDKQGLM
jgi:hypothetical protein